MAGVDRNEGGYFYLNLTGNAEMLTGDPLNPIDFTQLLFGYGGLFDLAFPNRGKDFVRFSIVRVPEPSSVALAAIAMMALVGVRKRVGTNYGVGRKSF